MKFRHAVVLVVLTALCACKLIDQNTFAPSPEAPPAPAGPAAPATDAADKRVPLLTIGFGTPNPNYKQLLEYAVRQAEAHRPDVAFDVISVVPANGDTVAQGLAASHGLDNAAEVMRAMIDLGVPDTRIHLGARTLSGLTENQVLVYLR